MEALVVDVGAVPDGEHKDVVLDVAVIKISAVFDVVEEQKLSSFRIGERYTFDVATWGFGPLLESLSTWINGRVMAAYNLPRVLHLLTAEYIKCGYTIKPGQAVDINLDDISFVEACTKEGITLAGHKTMVRAAAAAAMLSSQVRQGRQSLTEKTPARVTRHKSLSQI